MFSFHKPKIYRSNNGCCICKAKSSSSRFTDSKKYEDSFERCFLIKDNRSGEICNACVLLVKRCKKLPKESCKNWAHVVDARQGHKSTTKAKSLSQNNNATNIVSSSLTNRSTNRSSSKQSIHDENKKAERKICKKILFKSQQQIANENESNNVVSIDNDEIMQTTSTAIEEECDCSSCVYNRDLDELEKAQTSSSSIRRLKKTLPKKLCTESTSNSSSGNSSENDEDYLSDEKTNADKIMITRSGQMHSYAATVDPQTRNRMQGESLNKSASTKSKNKRKLTIRPIQRNESSTFLDMSYWKRETVCCGVIFRNKTNDMVLIDSKLFTPCACRKKKLEAEQKNMMEIELNSDKESTSDQDNNSRDKNNNLITSVGNLNRLDQSTSSGSANEDEISEKISVNLDDLNSSVDNQFANSINDPMNELVVVNLNSSSGISSDSSDISSITVSEEEEEEEDSTNLISDHNLMISSTKRTFGVL